MVGVAVPAMLAGKTVKKSGQIIEEKLGYNFVDLITKLAIFYVISFLITKYMEAVIYFQGGLEHVASLFGIKFVKADQLPNKWVDLFIDSSPTQDPSLSSDIKERDPGGHWEGGVWFPGTGKPKGGGIHQVPEGLNSDVKFKFWDLINAIAIFYISWEAYKYWERGGKDFLTLGIFGLLIAVLSVLSFSKFINRFSLNKFQVENK
jgi:hypothetical protein|tara:strand:- start:14 stop:628 length:615 start_codon:yes stop_codon:yes gene_type:complete